MFSHECLPIDLQRDIRDFHFGGRHKRRRVFTHCPFCNRSHSYPRHFKCKF